MRSSFTLLKKALDIFFENPKRFLTIMAIPAVLNFVSTYFEDFGTDSTAYTISTVLFVTSIVASMFMSVALIYAAANNDLSVKALYVKAKEQFLRYLGLSFGLFLIVAIGLFLLIIPGIYASVVFAFSTYFLLLEEKTIKDSLTASRELVKGKWWPVALRFLVLMSAGALLVIVSEFISGMVSIPLGDAFGYALSSTIIMFGTPIGIFFGYELFKDLKGSDTLTPTETQI